MKWGHRKQRPFSGLQRRRDRNISKYMERNPGVSREQAARRAGISKDISDLKTHAAVGLGVGAAGLATLGAVAAVGTIIKKHSNVKMSQLDNLFDVDKIYDTLSNNGTPYTYLNIQRHF
jgi:hypothetical protein